MCHWIVCGLCHHIWGLVYLWSQKSRYSKEVDAEVWNTTYFRRQFQVLTNSLPICLGNWSIESDAIRSHYWNLTVVPKKTCICKLGAQFILSCFGAVIEIYSGAKTLRCKLAFANWLVRSCETLWSNCWNLMVVPKRWDASLLHLRVATFTLNCFGRVIEIWRRLQIVAMQVFRIWKFGSTMNLFFFFLRWLRHAMGKARQDLSKAHPAFFTKYMMKTKFGSIWHFYCDHEIQGAIMKSWELMRG